VPIIGWCRSSTVTLGNNCIFIPREYDSSDLKENGTIPFYRRFFQRQRDAGTNYLMLVGRCCCAAPISVFICC
jgi:hypothetical protein